MLYTPGSVPPHATCLGLFVPQPRGLRPAVRARSGTQLDGDGRREKAGDERHDFVVVRKPRGRVMRMNAEVLGSSSLQLIGEQPHQRVS